MACKVLFSSREASERANANFQISAALLRGLRKMCLVLLGSQAKLGQRL